MKSTFNLVHVAHRLRGISENQLHHRLAATGAMAANGSFNVFPNGFHGNPTVADHVTTTVFLVSDTSGAEVVNRQKEYVTQQLAKPDSLLNTGEAVFFEANSSGFDVQDNRDTGQKGI